MNRKRARHILGIVMLLISLVILAWGLWPLAVEVRTLPVSPSEMQLPGSGGLLPGALAMAVLWAGGFA
ncbi:MAG: hypothetical protein JXA78_04575 [Anaerolineales bacterium]|nr:hypothetical protein [Anaerolineales bacterium]